MKESDNGLIHLLCVQAWKPHTFRMRLSEARWTLYPITLSPGFGIGAWISGRRHVVPLIKYQVESQSQEGITLS
jgi:hypothetical protein